MHVTPTRHSVSNSWRVKKLRGVGRSDKKGRGPAVSTRCPALHGLHKDADELFNSG